MTRSLLHIAVFLAGLAVVGWVAAGYVGVNPQALAVVVLIGACYLAGAFELLRYRRATASLSQALGGLTEPPAELQDWLGRLHPSLRPAARLRIEGERTALPGPALAPYLVGLLVLLGMLGTFLGMVATLRGTGAALEGATDLQAMRNALAAPVQGLGFAFGTSVAGVAASAMLGLLVALCRRERIQAAQQLDAAAATTLRLHSRAHQREETFKLMQRQADALPVLADRLQAMMAAMAAQTETLNARVAQDTELLATRLVQQAQALNTRLSEQAEALQQRLAAGQEAHHGKLDVAFTRLAASAEQALTHSAAESARTAGAVIQPAVAATLEGLSRETAAWREAMAEEVRGALARHADTFESRSASLVDGLAERVQAAARTMSQAWEDALSRQRQTGQTLTDETRLALQAASAGFAEQAATLVRTVDASHETLQARLASQEEARLAAWTSTLQAIAATLREEHEQAQARAAAQQHALADTLAQTAETLASRTQAQARDTLDEVGRLVEAAAQAPRAAAEAIAELRQQVSEGMARDNAMLDERARLLETLSTLLDAVNHASTEQRTAVDALVSSSADLLARVGERFTEQVESERGKLAQAAAEVTGGAAEVASLGEAFGVAVQRFGESNDKLVHGLERVEAALEKAGTRSDEQLAYYVAQAREVVELSVLSQQQILEAMQALGQASPAATQAEVAP